MSINRPIQKNHSQAVPRYLVFFDTESNAEEVPGENNKQRHTLRLGVAILGRWRAGKLSGRRVIRFTRWQQFWKAVRTYLRPRQTVWMFAHNIGFDLTLVNLWDLLDNEIFELSAPRRNRQSGDDNGRPGRVSSGLFVTESPPTIIGLQHSKGGRVVCCDTLNWWRSSLADIGKWSGVEKMPFPGLGAEQEELFQYCENDVKICEAAVCKLISWVEQHDLGMFRYTAPGQAYSAFRHRFMSHKIWPHDNDRLKQLERSGYFGGQYLLFKMGLIRGPVYQFDVNGLYASCMKDNCFPVDLERFRRGVKMYDREPSINLARAVATVQVDTDQLIPRRRQSGQVEYATGEFVTTLYGPELVRLHQLGHIKRWGAYALYKVQPIFTEYIEFFWQLRQRYLEEGDKISGEMCKMFLNSLYGKWAQRSSRWKHFPDVTLECLWGMHTRRDYSDNSLAIYRAISGEAFRKMPPAEKKDNFPAISGFICSFAREHMRKLREIAGPKNIYYQAVDSIAVNEQGRANLLLDGQLKETELGKLKLQCTGETAIFRAPSQYQIGSKQVMSGKKLTARELPDGSFEQLEFEKLNTILGSKPTKAVTVITVNKKFTTSRVRGKVGKDGWVTPPNYHMPSGEGW